MSGATTCTPVVASCTTRRRWRSADSALAHEPTLLPLSAVCRLPHLLHIVLALGTSPPGRPGAPTQTSKAALPWRHGRLCSTLQLQPGGQAAASSALPAAGLGGGAAAAAAASPALLRPDRPRTSCHAAAAAQLASSDCGDCRSAALCGAPRCPAHVSVRFAWALDSCCTAAILMDVQAQEPTQLRPFRRTQGAGRQRGHAHAAAAPVAVERGARGCHPGVFCWEGRCCRGKCGQDCAFAGLRWR